MTESPPPAATPTPSERAPGTSDAVPRSRRYLEIALILAVALAADLWSKAWAWDALRDGTSITLIENWFYFEFGFNTGAAFSLFRDGAYARVFFIVMTLAALAYMAFLAATIPTRYRTPFVAIALVASGALGNLHDRFVRVMDIRGEERYGVVDFIKVYYWPDTPWPTFNVADVALVVGAGLLFIFVTRHGDAMDAKGAAADDSLASNEEPERVAVVDDAIEGANEADAKPPTPAT